MHKFPILEIYRHEKIEAQKINQLPDLHTDSISSIYSNMAALDTFN
jgi:hypothetical protein